jgi:dipeptidyl-peptidase-2
MHLVLVVGVLVFASSAFAGFVPPPPTRSIQITQPVDHNTPPSTRATFQETVLLYEKFWRTSSLPIDERPIIVTMGGEAPVRGGYDHNGMLFEWGATIGALLVFPEHRYFGASMPFGANSHTRQNVQYLSVDQALRDYVEVISQIRQQFGTNVAPVIAVGGSYPGELAAYIRAKFPNDVDMALAASAPIGPYVSQYGFWRVASADFAGGARQCATIIRQAFVETAAAFNSGDPTPVINGLALCQQSSAAAQRDIVRWVENAFATFAMLDYPYAANDLPPNPAQAACDATETTFANSGNAIEALLSAVNVVYNTTSAPVQCHDIEAEAPSNCIDPTGCGTGSDGMSWDYLCCVSETAKLGTNNVTDVFPPKSFDLTAVNKYCNRVWGITPDLQFPEHYANFANATNIIFSNGYLDPWEPLGFLKSPNPGKVVTLQAFGAAHHLDLRGSDPADPKSVVQMRALEQQILSQWLNSTIALKRAARVH